jgi:hypothetical protein
VPGKGRWVVSRGGCGVVDAFGVVGFRDVVTISGDVVFVGSGDGSVEAGGGGVEGRAEGRAGEAGGAGGAAGGAGGGAAGEGDGEGDGEDPGDGD